MILRPTKQKFLAERLNRLIPNQDISISLGKDCYLDLKEESLVKDGLKIALSRIQFRLLYYLATQLGQIVRPKDLIVFTWGQHANISKEELYVYINRIRFRLEDNPDKPKCLITIRKVGYVLYPRQ